MALSGFYLDTELDDDNFRYIANTILDSPYTLEEVKWINKYEVFPILQANLLSMTGEWAGFDEDWLLDRITSRLRKKTNHKSISVEIGYYLFKGMCGDYWQAVERIYNDIQIGQEGEL